MLFVAKIPIKNKSAVFHIRVLKLCQFLLLCLYISPFFMYTTHKYTLFQKIIVLLPNTSFEKELYPYLPVLVNKYTQHRATSLLTTIIIKKYGTKKVFFLVRIHVECTMCVLSLAWNIHVDYWFKYCFFSFVFVLLYLNKRKITVCVCFFLWIKRFKTYFHALVKFILLLVFYILFYFSHTSIYSP